LGQEKLILGHNKTNYGTEKGDSLGQEKLILGHTEASLGQKMWILGTGEVNKMRCLLGTGEVILSHNKEE
jgi:hypothetical protein